MKFSSAGLTGRWKTAILMHDIPAARAMCGVDNNHCMAGGGGGEGGENLGHNEFQYCITGYTTHGK